MYGIFSGKNDFYDKLFYVLFFYRDMVEENGGGFEGKVIFSDEMDDFLSEFPIFSNVWAGYILMFGSLDFSDT